jgi:hypothetical protein
MTQVNFKDGHNLLNLYDELSCNVEKDNKTLTDCGSATRSRKNSDYDSTDDTFYNAESSIDLNG